MRFGTAGLLYPLSFSVSSLSLFLSVSFFSRLSFLPAFQSTFLSVQTHGGRGRVSFRYVFHRCKLPSLIRFFLNSKRILLIGLHVATGTKYY